MNILNIEKVRECLADLIKWNDLEEKMLRQMAKII